MKRILFSLMIAGAFALTAIPKANAATPPECGKTYAILLNGADASTVAQDGSATLPGAVTSAVGVGWVSFGAGTAEGCTTTGGALIYNAGDIQTNPQGLIGSGAHCYDAASALGTGVPCFDGSTYLSGSIAPSTAPYATGTLQFDFVATFNWVDASIETIEVPFGFTISHNAGASTAVGTSNVINTPENGPILTLTMSKEYIVPVPTAYTTSPYLGNSVINCSGYGANTTDFVASGQSTPGSAAGAYGSNVGAIEIFPTGSAGGLLSFNSNDELGSTSTPANNTACDFASFPGCSAPGYGAACGVSASAYADGTNNNLAFVTGGATCGDANTAGAGYSTSAVQWGPNDTNGYIIVTGLISDATGSVPPGLMSTCTELHTAPTGTVKSLLAPTTITANGTTRTYNLKITNTSPVGCDYTAALGSFTGTYTTFSLSGCSDLTEGGTVDTSCVVTCAQPSTANGAKSATASLTLSSTNCPVTGTGIPSTTVTCKN